MRQQHHLLQLDTTDGMSLLNITSAIREQIVSSGIQDGFVVVTSQHTTTALTINEDEARLREDIKTFFARLVPADDKYLHNDIHLRDCPPDEPENAHAHLIAMLLGSSEAIAVVAGQLQLGQWQSVMLVDLDGPRTRTVSIDIYGE